MICPALASESPVRWVRGKVRAWTARKCVGEVRGSELECVGGLRWVRGLRGKNSASAAYTIFFDSKIRCFWVRHESYKGLACGEALEELSHFPR